MLPLVRLALACASLPVLLPAQHFRPLSRVPFPALSAQTSACAIADVNLDGAADIAIIDFGTTNPIHLYLNDGYGGFTDVSTTHLPVAPARRGATTASPTTTWSWRPATSVRPNEQQRGSEGHRGNADRR